MINLSYIMLKAPTVWVRTRLLRQCKNSINIFNYILFGLFQNHKNFPIEVFQNFIYIILKAPHFCATQIKCFLTGGATFIVLMKSIICIWDVKSYGGGAGFLHHLPFLSNLQEEFPFFLALLLIHKNWSKILLCSVSPTLSRAPQTLLLWLYKNSFSSFPVYKISGSNHLCSRVNQEEKTTATLLTSAYVPVFLHMYSVCILHCMCTASTEFLRMYNSVKVML